MMEGGAKKGVPVFIGSAGGGGGDPHVDWLMEIVREIATEKGLHPKVAVIRSEQSKDALKAKARAGRSRRWGRSANLPRTRSRARIESSQ